jgi:hypothetical protein
MLSAQGLPLISGDVVLDRRHRVEIYVWDLDDLEVPGSYCVEILASAKADDAPMTAPG